MSEVLSRLEKDTTVHADVVQACRYLELDMSYEVANLVMMAMWEPTVVACTPLRARESRGQAYAWVHELSELNGKLMHLFIKLTRSTRADVLTRRFNAVVDVCKQQLNLALPLSRDIRTDIELLRGRLHRTRTWYKCGYPCGTYTYTFNEYKHIAIGLASIIGAATGSLMYNMYYRECGFDFEDLDLEDLLSDWKTQELLIGSSNFYYDFSKGWEEHMTKLRYTEEW